MAGVSLSPRFVRFLPPHGRGLRIGLLGGSFNPAHPAHRLANHPKIHVTALESVLRTRYTIDTVQHLRPRCPGVHFVWIMGSDNFLQFHHWKQWPEIAASVPMAVIDRPGTTLKSLHGRAAHRFASQRVPEQRASGLLKRKAPAWVFLHDRRSALSSTLLRSQGL
jgi:nicotinate-nucleotide adenylyltransferase